MRNHHEPHRINGATFKHRRHSYLPASRLELWDAELQQTRRDKAWFPSNRTAADKHALNLPGAPG